MSLRKGNITILIEDYDVNENSVIVTMLHKGRKVRTEMHSVIRESKTQLLYFFFANAKWYICDFAAAVA